MQTNSFGKTCAMSFDFDPSSVHENGSGGDIEIGAGVVLSPTLQMMMQKYNTEAPLNEEGKTLEDPEGSGNRIKNLQQQISKQASVDGLLQGTMVPAAEERNKQTLRIKTMPITTRSFEKSPDGTTESQNGFSGTQMPQNEVGLPHDGSPMRTPSRSRSSRSSESDDGKVTSNAVLSPTQKLLMGKYSTDENGRKSESESDSDTKNIWDSDTALKKIKEIQRLGSRSSYEDGPANSSPITIPTPPLPPPAPPSTPYTSSSTPVHSIPPPPPPPPMAGNVPAPPPPPPIGGGVKFPITTSQAPAGSLASAIAGATLKKRDLSETKSVPIGVNPMDDMMNALNKKLLARKKAAESGGSDLTPSCTKSMDFGTPPSTPPLRKVAEYSPTLPLTPSSARKYGSLARTTSNAVDVDYKKFKDEIIQVLRDEIKKAKDEIIKELRLEISGSTQL